MTSQFPPTDVANYGLLNPDQIRSVFRRGRVGPLSPGEQMIPKDDQGAVVVYGHPGAKIAIHGARFFGGGTGEVSEVRRVFLLFTERPFDGREAPPGSTVCWTVVPAGTSDAVPATVVIFAADRPAAAAVKPAGRVPDRNEVKDILGEGVHTGLRKAVDSSAAWQTHQCITNLSPAEWDRVLNFALDGLAAAGYHITSDPTQCGDWPAPCNCDDPLLHNGH
jgi:hypothetical protein